MAKLMTALAAERRASGLNDRPVRILNVMGLRASESRDPARRAVFRHDTPNGRRHVDEWLPIRAHSDAEL